MKGYPKATSSIDPSKQAAHWLKQANFDIIDYRGGDQSVSIAAAFPDVGRYHALATRIRWLKAAADFTY